MRLRFTVRRNFFFERHLPNRILDVRLEEKVLVRIYFYSPIEARALKKNKHCTLFVKL